MHAAAPPCSLPHAHHWRNHLPFLPQIFPGSSLVPAVFFRGSCADNFFALSQLTPSSPSASQPASQPAGQPLRNHNSPRTLPKLAATIQLSEA